MWILVFELTTKKEKKKKNSERFLPGFFIIFCLFLILSQALVTHFNNFFFLLIISIFYSLLLLLSSWAWLTFRNLCVSVSVCACVGAHVCVHVIMKRKFWQKEETKFQTKRGKQDKQHQLSLKAQCKKKKYKKVPISSVDHCRPWREASLYSKLRRVCVREWVSECAEAPVLHKQKTWPSEPLRIPKAKRELPRTMFDKRW